MLDRIFIFLLSAALALFPAIEYSGMARASNASLFSPTTGTVSGLQLTNNYNSALDALNTKNSGSSAPANQLSGSASLFNEWCNTASAPYPCGIWDGAQYLNRLYVDPTNHIPITPIGGGTATLTAASTTDLWSVPQNFITISGNTAITQFASADAVPGQQKFVCFTGTPTLTQGTPLNLPNNGSNITVTANDCAVVTASGTTNVNVGPYQRANGTPLATGAVNVGASSLNNSALAFTVPTNMQINTSVGSSALTITVEGNGSTAYSSSNPGLFAFRDATLANGDPVIVSQQSNLTFTIASGNTMGCQSGVTCRLWIWAINNAGTNSLLVYNAENASGLNPQDLNEAALQTCPSGTSGGSSAQTIYCSAGAVTSKAVKRLGYIDISESTAGTWNSNATIIQLFGPGIHKPGEIVQGPFTTTTSTSTGSTTALAAATNLTQAITPTSVVNIIGAMANVSQFITSGSATAMQLARASCSNLFGNQFVSGTIQIQSTIPFNGFDAPASTSSLTYEVCFKNSVNGDGVVNSTQAGYGTPSSNITVWEIMAALDRPANDNINPGRFALIG